MRQLHNIIIAISIHAPAKGATFFAWVSSSVFSYFNPRSREGSDTLFTTFLSQPRHFNPRSREGSDITNCQIFYFYKNFNPRSREGSDLRISSTISGVKYFNPRSREGSDSNIIQQISFSLYNTVYFVSNNIK